MTSRPISCDEALKQVFEFIDHELGEHDHGAMQEHLDTCRACFSRVEFERRLKARIGELHDEEPSIAIENRIRRMIRSF